MTEDESKTKWTAWEYNFVYVPCGRSIAEVCQQYGLIGWEAWHVASMNGEHTLYFKRPVERPIVP